MSENRELITAEGCKINYILTRKNVKNINLRIKKDGKVSVSANRYVPIHIIENFIKAKADFILKAINKYTEIDKNAVKQKEFIDGEIIKLLDKNLLLKVSEGNIEGLQAFEGYLHMTVKDKNNYERKKALFSKWTDKQCLILFNEIARSIYTYFEKYGISYPVIKIRSMTTRWGSCQPKKGIITLNKALLELPRCCIEYVILHEFSHFIHPNHSKKFYAFVENLMPDWKERKLRLKQLR